MAPYHTQDTDYEKIFHPARLAIAGVSADGGLSFGSSILRALLAMGYQGEIFPVNPKGGTFAGLSIYEKVEDIPGTLDYVIISVAAKAVPAILEACRKKGAAGAQIISSGFSELGTPEGIALEEEIRAIAEKGIRVIGPNCFGIYCPECGLTFLPNPDLPREVGTVAFLSQSGGMASDFANTGKWMGIRFSKVVSFGNGVDLRETELLRYLGADPQTRVIAMYIEGIKDGDAFFEELQSVSRKKPVIVYKGGLSLAGQRAVVSHTASMGGSGIIWPSILTQLRAVQAHDMLEMAQACLAFSQLPPRALRGISVVGGGGALGVAACDAAESFGIEIPQLRNALKARIESFLPKSGASASNPIDVANPYIAPETLKQILLVSAQDDRIDCQVVISLLYHFRERSHATGKPIAEVVPYRELADVMRDVVRDTGKPVIIVLPNTRRGLDDLDIVEMQAHARQAFIEHGLPVFDEIGDAIRAIGHMNTYYGER
jgi:acyl-CoA synthetase (NDP forming)